MGKDKPGFLTPKAIANRIKSKGLQKLRWYCQMCQKQCRDENGFKCHTMSESHQRQLLLFADNQGYYMDDFSGQFKRDFLLTLRRRFGTKRVHANIVYQEYISDRHHLHMNSTKWLTLTDFVQYLGREGICVVDQTEKGWFIQYIDRDPETIKRQEELQKKHKLDIDDRDRQLMYIEKQIQRAKEKEGDKTQEYTEFKKTDEDTTIKISFKKMKKEEDSSVNNDTNRLETNSRFEINDEMSNSLDKNDNSKDTSDSSDENSQQSIDNIESQKFDEEKGNLNTDSSEIKSKIKNFKFNSFKKPTILSTSNPTSSSQSVFHSTKTEKRKLSALEEIMKTKESQREQLNRKDHWLHKNIIVRIVTDKLGEKYSNAKGIVMSVKDRYVGIIKVLGMDSIIKVDQAHLQTVLPAIGKKVLIVNGAYRGLEAILEEINNEKLLAKLSIASGPLKGRILENIEFEDISKIHTEEK